MDVVTVAAEPDQLLTKPGRQDSRRIPGIAPRVPRLAGIDVARGLAVLGMYAAHVGPDPSQGGAGVLFRPFEGRSAALFAVLAGVSIALMSGGREPKTGLAQTRVSLRLATRAPLIMALGLWLTNLNTGYLVILSYYGICFLVAIPFLRMRAKALAIAAAVTAVVVPFASYFIRAAVAPRDLYYLLPDARFEHFGSFGEALTILVLTGTFPAVGLMTYLFAGMAIGRLDLRSPLVCRRLFLGGTALAVLAYGASYLATDVFGGMRRIYETLAPAAARAGMTPEQYFGFHLNNIHGTPPTTTLAWELVSSAHSYTPFDFVACIGVAAAVIGGCQLLMRRCARFLRPLADLGSVILSAYVFHFIAIWLLWNADDESAFSLLHFLEFSAVAIVAAVAWKRWIGRGPLEWLLHVLSKWPNRVIRPRIPAQRS
ncbi:heparan-alpha-glucosaminide N-acetyltransferase domain-containing protein [Amycolatopsis anabasis]|uniref:heparan-alpha-glucosaminide N-acetyltransferase domain-containing protein n=1 Tax=Amycolatopsis anabasis TaxID=1840409 RepID=UPI001FEB23DA|nr:heparan-alpha-glucosaminide N-acetyltransferase domain-containing protein [Amycolatopsis anabasis]